jgi:CelD/BcsL family acetyltransferase involved in cellulose biosynthesis
MLQVQRIESIGSLASLAEEWQTLHTGLSPSTPFTSPLWNILWWQHLRRQRSSIHDELFTHTVRDAGRLIAVAPMMLTHMPARGMWRTRKLQFFGADPAITEIRGLVSDPSHQSAALEALSRELFARQSHWDWLEWNGIRQGTGADAWLDKTACVNWGEQIPNYFVRLPATWDEFKSGRSRNIKESLRKCYNSLKRDGHRFNFRLSTNADETAAALARFFQLHSARSAIQTTVRHADYFESAHSRNFLIDYARQAAPHGNLHVFELEIDGTVVAARLGFALDKELYLYYSGFLPDWGKYSVMTTLVAETMKWAIQNGFTTINLSTGDDESKRRWGPTAVVYRNAVQIGPSWRNRLAHRLFLQSKRYRPSASKVR